MPGEHEFVVPPGVSSLQATLIGGNGAPGNGGFPGGTGATVTATLSVTPGETLYIEVASDGIALPSGFGSPGGYGGGGAGKHIAALAKAKAKKKTPTAATISFDLSEAATLALSFEQSRPGVTMGKRCVTKSKRNAKGKRCSLWVPYLGGVTRAGHEGLDKIRFEGVLDAKKPLPAGAYRLTLRRAIPAAARSRPSTQPSN